MFRKDKLKSLTKNQQEVELTNLGLPDYYVQYILNGTCSEENQNQLNFILFLLNESVPVSQKIKLVFKSVENISKAIEEYFQQLNTESIEELKEILDPEDFQNLWVNIDQICFIQHLLNQRQNSQEIDELFNQINTYTKGKHSWRYTQQELNLSDQIIINPGNQQQSIYISEKIHKYIRIEQKQVDEIIQAITKFTDENESNIRHSLHNQLNKIPQIGSNFKITFEHSFNHYIIHSKLKRGDKTRIKRLIYSLISRYYSSLPCTQHELQIMENRTSVSSSDFNAFIKYKTDLWFNSNN